MVYSEAALQASQAQSGTAGLSMADAEDDSVYELTKQDMQREFAAQRRRQQHQDAGFRTRERCACSLNRRWWTWACRSVSEECCQLKKRIFGRISTLAPRSIPHGPAGTLCACATVWVLHDVVRFWTPVHWLKAYPRHCAAGESARPAREPPPLATQRSGSCCRLAWSWSVTLGPWRSCSTSLCL